MNDRRQEAISGLVLQIHNKRDQFLYANQGCGFECSSIMYGALTKQMHSNALLSPRPEAPFPGRSYSALAKTVVSFKLPQWFERPLRYSGYSQVSKHSCVYSSISTLFGDLDDAIEGLDLNNFVNH